MTRFRDEELDSLGKLNQQQFNEQGDSEIATRIAQYELAFRMQMSVPELIDFSKEPKHILESYGPEVNKVGKYAYNCLLARRLAERGSICQLFHRGWDAPEERPTM